MSHLSQSTVYGNGYDLVEEKPLSAEDQAMFENEAEVRYSKDDKGNVLDKKCLVFFRKSGGYNYGTLDRNSKLNIGDKVNIASVKEKTLSNGENTIYRYDA